MKLLFIENRYKTQLWQAIAERLGRRGHTIVWIVQNHGFTPIVGKPYSIPYPQADDRLKSLVEDVHVRKVRASDRNLNYFGGDDSHYAHYDAEIRRVLELERPDVVFGESTLFHELLTIRNCREMGIPFLHPTSSRYPTGRFVFLLNDTQEPQWGSGDQFSSSEAQQWIQQIANRQVIPDYMKGTVARKKLIPSTNALVDRLRTIRNYLAGERYNTPSPVRKIALNNQRQRNIRRWEEMAAQVPTGKLTVLYPLQYQPEANLDIWGHAYRDQPSLVAALAEALPKDTLLLLKPNPKSYYEISEELLNTVARLPRDKVVALSHQVSMAEIFDSVDLFVTVTGTIAIEAIFASKPVVTLIRTLNNDNSGCPFIEAPSSLKNVVEQLRLGRFPSTNEEQKLRFLQCLMGISHKGVISDPLSDPNVLSAHNLADIEQGFQHVIQAIADK